MKEAIHITSEWIRRAGQGSIISVAGGQTITISSLSSHGKCGLHHFYWT